MRFREACEVYRTRKAEQFEAASQTVVDLARAGPLSVEDVANLAAAMAVSGDSLSVPVSLNPVVDVPSTGGPASLSTLLCPLLLASLGDYIPKLSATGSIAGGIDTMGLLPGFRTDLWGEEFIAILSRARFAHAEPSANFCPADTSLVRARRKAKLMANMWLAAASLLAKKAAIPGVACVFDFRVGLAGNIGNTVAEARQAAELFRRVADILGIKIGVILTDNASFPCSALGRLESLHLLWSTLRRGNRLSKLDHEHIETCVIIAAHAHHLVDRQSVDTSIRQIQDALDAGGVHDVFVEHITAQGSSRRGLEQLMELREAQMTATLEVDSHGYWQPPPVNDAKNWLKTWQSKVSASIGSIGTTDRSTAGAQVGMRLLVSAGDVVSPGRTTVELRFPPDHPPEHFPDWLAGSVIPEEPLGKSQLIGPS
jgi:pyrimidine-nucleoside phosphorylase